MNDNPTDSPSRVTGARDPTDLLLCPERLHVLAVEVVHHLVHVRHVPDDQGSLGRGHAHLEKGYRCLALQT